MVLRAVVCALVVTLRATAVQLPRRGAPVLAQRPLAATTTTTASQPRAALYRTAFGARAAVLDGDAEAAPTAPRRPTLRALWGVLGVTAMLLNAVKRVLPLALEPLSAAPGTFGAVKWAYYAAFAVGMGYAEGYKAFHLKFSPLVVARSIHLGESASNPVLHGLLAPLYAMGLFSATKKRKITSWTFLIGVFGLVKLVKKLAYPWRSIVDGGVVVGLTVGSASILYHYARALAWGIPVPADKCLPEK